MFGFVSVNTANMGAATIPGAVAMTVPSPNNSLHRSFLGQQTLMWLNLRCYILFLTFNSQI